MANHLQFEENGVEILIITNEHDNSDSRNELDDSGFEKAGIGSVFSEVKTCAAKSLQESLQVVSAVANSFSKLLDSALIKPSTAEIMFGIEASGKADILVIGQISGKSNFQVKIAWNFDNPKK